MPKSPYTTHAVHRTLLGEKVFRSRQSLQESQAKFAKRFRVSNITVHNWETGKVTYMQHIYQEILVALVKRLEAEGRYLPVGVYEAYIVESNSDLVRA